MRKRSTQVNPERPIVVDTTKRS